MKVVKFLFLGLMVLNLAACGGDDEVQDILSGFKPQPPKSDARLNGTWTSGCIDSEFGSYYGRRIITSKFSNNNFETHVDIYYTLECTGTADRRTSYVGTYDIQHVYDAKTFLLEYNIPVDAQVSQLFNQKIQINDQNLYTSELDSGFEKKVEDYSVSLIMIRVN